MKQIKFLHSIDSNLSCGIAAVHVDAVNDIIIKRQEESATFEVIANLKDGRGLMVLERNLTELEADDYVFRTVRDINGVD